jgi:hypothetical protein
LVMNIGRLYRREGEKQTLLYVGTRHVWRYGRQSVKGVRREFFITILGAGRKAGVSQDASPRSAGGPWMPL